MQIRNEERTVHGLLKVIEENQPKTNKCVLVFQAGEDVNVGEGCRVVITA